MPKPRTSRWMLALRDERTGGQLAVPLEAFVKFSKAMDRDLERMVAQWSHLAAPLTRPVSREKFRGCRR